MHPGAITDSVLAFVQGKSASVRNRFGLEFVEQHLRVMQNFALVLAERFGADQKAVTTAALLHDISAIEDFDCVPVHSERGAERILELLVPGGELSGIGFDPGRIERVATCVREHSAPRRHGETIVESVCVSNADAMSQITQPFFWYNYARQLKSLSHGDARAWYKALVERNWEPLIDAAKNLIREDYEAVIVITR